MSLFIWYLPLSTNVFVELSKIMFEHVFPFQTMIVLKVHKTPNVVISEHWKTTWRALKRNCPNTSQVWSRWRKGKLKKGWAIRLERWRCSDRTRRSWSEDIKRWKRARACSEKKTWTWRKKLSKSKMESSKNWGHFNGEIKIEKERQT